MKNNELENRFSLGKFSLESQGEREKFSSPACDEFNWDIIGIFFLLPSPRKMKSSLNLLPFRVSKPSDLGIRISQCYPKINY